ncbi:MAG: bifunctional folylpolyglutamate synthase/dihydrofolate synthase [Chloroflexi bacterium]|nr:bifunctional folylpolyglutamate synthase/dihydrofolate synthase [Chloroflexota bacterium]
MVSDTRDRYMKAVNRLLSLADFERKSRANQPPDWHLRRVERLMEMLGDPHLTTPVIHVAGSKGKGSTCAMIASGLKAAGFKAGLYTSPHLHTFTERIQINGAQIAQSDFADLIDELWPCVEAIERTGGLGVVSVFEMLTAMAFVHFRDNADIAVIETGLGGRLDATNVVNPEVAVITSISKDHVRILGDKISLIAAEKAGIIKSGKPTVVAKNHPVTWRVIRERAAEVGSELVGACATVPLLRDAVGLGGDLRQEFALGKWRPPETIVSNEILRTPPDPGLTDIEVCASLLGSHQIDNARTAAATLNVLYQQGHAFDVNAAMRGIGDASWPCRCEILKLDDWPLMMLDGAHNDASLKALRDTLRPFGGLIGEDSANACGPTASYVLIIGSTEGHEFDNLARELAASAFHTVATQSRHPKSSPANRLVQAGREHGIEFSEQLNVEGALREAKRLVEENPQIQLIVVTGSLFVAAEARELLLGIEPEIYEDLKQPYVMPYESESFSRSKIA